MNLFLGEMEGDHSSLQYVLVLKEGQLRVYSYEYVDDDNAFIFCDEPGWERCEEYFDDFEGYLKLDSLIYTDIDYTNIEDTTLKISRACRTWVNGVSVKAFLEKHKDDLGKKVYNYYK